MMTKCVVCGCLFPTRTNTKTCSLKCREINTRKVNNKCHRVAYARNKIKKDVKACRAKSLDNDVAEARRLGMSYGLYMALKRGE